MAILCVGYLEALNIVKYFDEVLSANDYIDKLQWMLPLQLVRYGKKLSDW